MDQEAPRMMYRKREGAHIAHPLSFAYGPSSPCAGWLPLESPGKPTTPSPAPAPYPAGLRKVGRFLGRQPSQGPMDIAAP